jgi:3-isopropylmalate dehydrogenase
MEKHIALVAGDGIGPEIVREGRKVLEQIGRRFGVTFIFKEALAGGAAIDSLGEPLPAATIAVCQAADSILLGAVGGPKWDNLPADKRPEQAIIGLRKGLELYANIRPARFYTALMDSSPLKHSLLSEGIDFLIVRELIGGLYIGQHSTGRNAQGQLQAQDTLIYTEPEIERIGRCAFELARQRSKKLTSVDKANVLDSSRLWRQVMHRLCQEYPEVDYEDMLVDNCAMQLIRRPSQFDVIVTENMFGDILSDEASMLGGSIGLIPSMSLGTGSGGLYEPIHGSAPDIAGQNKANPIGTILSCAMMLRHSLQLPAAAAAIENAVETVLNQGYATADIISPGKKPVSCSQMGDLICRQI